MSRRRQSTQIYKIGCIIVSTSATIIIFSLLLAFNFGDQELTTLNPQELETLRFVQVIFRHGERTPLNIYNFPNDPYRNFTYPPYGIGGLTNKGKNQIYRIGRKLRQRYGPFLDDYSPNLIKSTSSDSPRTQASLQLVLAGLFPPIGEQIWANSMHWQPIPYKIIPKGYDQIFNGYYCPGYKKLYRAFINTPEILQKYQNNEIFDYVSLHTGLNLTRPAHLQIIYDLLRSQERYGLILPEWTKTVYPEKLEKFAIMTFQIYLGTDRLKRLLVGYLLKQLLEEINDKIDGKMDEKFSLYAAHDINILGIGLTLNLFEDPIIPFGAYIITELHEINNNYTLKFYYQDYSGSEPRIVVPFNGGAPVTVDAYLKLIENFLPEAAECEEGPDGVIHYIYDF